MKPEIGKVFKDPRYLLAFGLGSGLAPRAPGTAGSLVALLLFFPLHALGPVAYVVIVVLTFIAGIFICDHVARDMKIKDPASIVLDEFVGLWIALLFLPQGWYWAIAGFCLFRAFDIIKPWPVGWLDKHIGGGPGIMIDDVAAGVYAWVLLQAAAFGLACWLG